MRLWAKVVVVLVVLLPISPYHVYGFRSKAKLQELSNQRIIKEWRDVVYSGLGLDNKPQKKRRSKKAELSVKSSNSSIPTNDTTSTTTSTSEIDEEKKKEQEPEYIRLGPCQGNLYEWHFTFAGPPNTIFEGGVYHGRILLPKDYPQSAPRVQMLTPSGRFETKTDICLSASAHHQETWTPMWRLRGLVAALRSYMACKPVEIGGVEASESIRRVLASSSRNWRCSVCGCNHKNFPGKIFKNLPEVGFGNTYIHEHTYTQTSQVTYNFEELEFYEKVLEESASAINARMREEDEGEGEGGGRAYAWPNKEALDYPPSPGLLGIVRSILMDTRILMTVFLVLFLYLNFSR